MPQSMTLPRLPEGASHRAGSLETRLARGAEVDAALALRHRVFCEERGAISTGATAGLEEDAYDRDCDHLIVLDHARPDVPVVGTYRLLRGDVADRIGGFYSGGEYDLAPLIRHAAQCGAGLLELGRSCVEIKYRNSTAISLLWRGLATYLEAFRIGYIFGCASFHGTDVAAHADGLSYLHRLHLAPPELRVRALRGHYVEMDAPGADLVAGGQNLPPLVKAYLRVGAKVGDGEFIDHTFNTVDVFMVMPVERIVGRYGRRFGLVD